MLNERVSLDLIFASDDLAFFAAQADSASLAEAVRKLNVTVPAVFQRLLGLEARAWGRLPDRCGRHSKVTDEGRLVAEHGAQVADAMEAPAGLLANRTRNISGHLRANMRA